MTKTLAILLGIALTGMVATAAEGEKKEAPARKLPPTLEKYDKDKDGKLSDEERKEYRKDREAEMLKKYDKNNDGKLDETERAAMKEDMKKTRGERGERKGQKKDK